MNHQNIEELLAEFDKRFRPIDFCHVGDNKMTHVEYVRDGIKSFLLSAYKLGIEKSIEEITEEILKNLK